jgi:arsenite methyltransferase
MPFLTQQLAHPSGVLARWFLANLWNRRNAALNDAAFSLVTHPPASRVLEVGFGGGYLLKRILTEMHTGSPVFTAGIDHSLEMVKYCRWRFRQQAQLKRLFLAVATSNHLPWPAICFDCVVSVNSLFYWTDPVGAFSEFSRVLSPQGRLVLIYTCADDLQNRPFDSRNLNFHEPEQVQKWLCLSGFSAVEITQGQDRFRRFWCILGTKVGDLN